MNRKSLILALILIAAIGTLFFLIKGNASGGIPSADLMANTGFSDMATGTLTVTTTASTSIGTIPNGCHAVEVYTSQDLNYGSGDVPTGTNSPYIPAGTSKIFTNLNSSNPTIYFRARSTTATVTLIGGHSSVSEAKTITEIAHLSSGVVDIKECAHLSSGVVDVKELAHVSSGAVEVTLSDATTGFKAVSATIVTTFATTQTSIGTLPAGTKAFAIYVPLEGTPVQYGPSDVGSMSHPNLAAGAMSDWFTVNTLTPSVYITTKSGGPATATILAK